MDIYPGKPFRVVSLMLRKRYLSSCEYGWNIQTTPWQEPYYISFFQQEYEAEANRQKQPALFPPFFLLLMTQDRR